MRYLAKLNVVCIDRVRKDLFPILCTTSRSDDFPEQLWTDDDRRLPGAALQVTNPKDTDCAKPVRTCERVT